MLKHHDTWLRQLIYDSACTCLIEPHKFCGRAVAFFQREEILVNPPKLINVGRPHKVFVDLPDHLVVVHAPITLIARSDVIQFALLQRRSKLAVPFQFVPESAPGLDGYPCSDEFFGRIRHGVDDLISGTHPQFSQPALFFLNTGCHALEVSEPFGANDDRRSGTLLRAIIV